MRRLSFNLFNVLPFLRAIKTDVGSLKNWEKCPPSRCAIRCGTHLRRGDIESALGVFFYEIDESEKIVYLTAAAHRSVAY